MVGPAKWLLLPSPVDFQEPGPNDRLETCWRLLSPCPSPSSALSQPVVLLLLSTGSLTSPLVCRHFSLLVLVWILINRHFILPAASVSGLSSLKSFYPPTLTQSNIKRCLLWLPAPDTSSVTADVFCHLKHPFLT